MIRLTILALMFAVSMFMVNMCQAQYVYRYTPRILPQVQLRQTGTVFNVNPVIAGPRGRSVSLGLNFSTARVPQVNTYYLPRPYVYGNTLYYNRYTPYRSNFYYRVR